MKLSLFAELRRRNVFRAAILYVGAVWALAQGISQLGPSVGAPEWTTRWFLLAAVIVSMRRIRTARKAVNSER